MKTSSVIRETVKDGLVIVFSDCHYWPGEPSTAHRGLVRLCEELAPSLVVANGDVLDGARISKHARIGWAKTPTVQQELEVCKVRLGEIADAVGLDVPLIWPLGNHDARFETFLSNKVPEYAGVRGFSLREHFPEWRACWQLRLNAGTLSETVIKHRWLSGTGAQATYNNTVKCGTNIVTGHLHSGKTTPYTDYQRTRYGVDCGTLADYPGPQFTDYTETNPNDWRSGFAILTYHKGLLLPPEHAQVVGEGQIAFRGEVLDV